MINADCGSSGVTGLIAGATSGNTATGSFTPQTSGIYTICVDATRNQPSAAGTFNLQITSP